MNRFIILKEDEMYNLEDKINDFLYEDDIEYGEIFCKECENTGETIEEIAKWE